MGRSFLTVRALVLTVTCLVCLEYFSLLQSIDISSPHAPPIYRQCESRGCNDPSTGRSTYRRHVLQALDIDKLRMATAFASLSKNSSNTSTNNSSGVKIEGKGVDELPQCPMIPPGLHGRFPVILDSLPSMLEMEEGETELGLELGGVWHPPGCKARHRVAIIVPYRDREPHLRAFLHNIHRFLQRQQIMYGIYIVEQVGSTPFNRAMLMNVGAAEALKQHDYQCFIFHDVDLLPEDDRNLYTCPIQPRHMSVSIDSFLYRLPYDDIFGGVSALTVDQFQSVNGFSNMFWGWGGEDDDMANRLRVKKLFISRYPANIARYKMLKHTKDKANPERFKFLYSGAKRMTKDGYNNLKYHKENFVLKRLYTWILVDLPRLKV